MKPQRIQRSRAKGWRMPPGAVYVGRPSKWGNPFVVGKDSIFGFVKDAGAALGFYLGWLATHPDGQRIVEDARRELRGKSLACWCRPGCPCHADVLLRLSNGDHPKKAHAFPDQK